MTPEQVEELLRSAGRPERPPDRLRRAVLGLPPARVAVPDRRLRFAAALLAGAVAVVLAVAVFEHGQQGGFRAVATVELHGVSARAVAELGPLEGPNRPVHLVVQHLQPGDQRYFELWSLREQPPMMLTTFMTNRDGSCVITFSAPATVDWRDLVITPRNDPKTHLLCTGQAGC